MELLIRALKTTTKRKFSSNLGVFDQGEICNEFNCRFSQLSGAFFLHKATDSFKNVLPRSFIHETSPQITATCSKRPSWSHFLSNHNDKKFPLLSPVEFLIAVNYTNGFIQGTLRYVDEVLIFHLATETKRTLTCPNHFLWQYSIHPSSGHDPSSSVGESSHRFIAFARVPTENKFSYSM